MEDGNINLVSRDGLCSVGCRMFSDGALLSAADCSDDGLIAPGTYRVLFRCFVLLVTCSGLLAVAAADVLRLVCTYVFKMVVDGRDGRKQTTVALYSYARLRRRSKLH